MHSSHYADCVQGKRSPGSSPQLLTMLARWWFVHSRIARQFSDFVKAHLGQSDLCSSSKANIPLACSGFGLKSKGMPIAAELSMMPARFPVGTESCICCTFSAVGSSSTSLRLQCLHLGRRMKTHPCGLCCNLSNDSCGTRPWHGLCIT